MARVYSIFINDVLYGYLCAYRANLTVSPIVLGENTSGLFIRRSVAREYMPGIAEKCPEGHRRKHAATERSARPALSVAVQPLPMRRTACKAQCEARRSSRAPLAREFEALSSL